MGVYMSKAAQAFDPWAFVFNTPLECGLRSTALLISAYPNACDLQRLVQYDYLVVHSGDVDGGPPSIHPATPHRSGELLVRRSLVEQGLEFMARKLVVEKAFTGQGIGFRAGEYASVFLGALISPYTQQLCARAAWVVERFQRMSDETLNDYMRTQWSHWGAEFVRDSLFDLGE
jgi:hypothetical protein